MDHAITKHTLTAEQIVAVLNDKAYSDFMPTSCVWTISVPERQHALAAAGQPSDNIVYGSILVGGTCYPVEPTRFEKTESGYRPIGKSLERIDEEKKRLIQAGIIDKLEDAECVVEPSTEKTWGDKTHEALNCYLAIHTKDIDVDRLKELAEHRAVAKESADIFCHLFGLRKQSVSAIHPKDRSDKLTLQFLRLTPEQFENIRDSGLADKISIRFGALNANSQKVQGHFYYLENAPHGVPANQMGVVMLDGEDPNLLPTLRGYSIQREFKKLSASNPAEAAAILETLSPAAKSHHRIGGTGHIRVTPPTNSIAHD